MSPTRTDYIAIPWKRRLQRLQHTAMPVVTFIACVALTLWLWQRQGRLPNAVGEVEAVRIDLAAGSDGVLVPLAHRQWTLFDHVEADTVVARLDDRAVRAEMATLAAESARLRVQLDAMAEEIRVEQSGRESDHRREYRQLVWQCQECRLDLLDRRAALEADRIECMRLERGLAFLESLGEKGTVTEMRISDQRLGRDAVRKRIEEGEQALAEATRRREAAEAALRDYPEVRAADTDKLLGPLEAAITVGERQLDELRVRIEGLEIRSPISGTVCAIHKWPGQNLRAGEPIMTIAAEHGRYIVSYVRQEQRVRPAVGMPVEVRVRGSTSPPVTAVVGRIGPQVEPVPPRQLQDASKPEWGLPVFISTPPELKLRPGELIDVTFNRRSADDSG